MIAVKRPALVVGADSLLGAALSTELSKAGLPTIGTTRRSAASQATGLRLDLAEPSDMWTIPAHVEVAFLCAGITSVDFCERHPAATAAINVDAVTTLAARLADRGAFVVYLSSDHVFDDSVDDRRAEADPAPLSEYGRQKAEAESRIRQLGNVAIVRLTKVVSRSFPLLQQWASQLRQGTAVEAFEDVALAPVSLPFAVQALLRIGQRSLPGTFHISARSDITYFESARHLASRIGVAAAFVHATRASDGHVVRRRRRSALDTSTLASALAIHAPDPMDAIDYHLGLLSV